METGLGNTGVCLRMDDEGEEYRGDTKEGRGGEGRKGG
jgi:hypothetical protein